jgi:hypothetical protein
MVRTAVRPRFARDRPGAVPKPASPHPRTPQHALDPAHRRLGAAEGVAKSRHFGPVLAGTFRQEGIGPRHDADPPGRERPGQGQGESGRHLHATHATGSKESRSPLRHGKASLPDGAEPPDLVHTGLPDRASVFEVRQKQHAPAAHLEIEDGIGSRETGRVQEVRIALGRRIHHAGGGTGPSCRRLHGSMTFPGLRRAFPPRRGFHPHRHPGGTGRGSPGGMRSNARKVFAAPCRFRRNSGLPRPRAV